MSDPVAELRALLDAATPGPDRVPPVDAVLALREALRRAAPELLAVVEAARAWRAWREDPSDDIDLDDDVYETEPAIWAALDALDAKLRAGGG